MKVKVCSGFSDRELEEKIQSAIEDKALAGLTLCQICYSMASAVTYNSWFDLERAETRASKGFYKSAILIFDKV